MVTDERTAPPRSKNAAGLRLICFLRKPQRVSGRGARMRFLVALDLRIQPEANNGPGKNCRKFQGGGSKEYIQTRGVPCQVWRK